MKFEEQVCSLELAKRLKEIEVKQESLYAYILSEFGVVDGKSYTNQIMLTHGEISSSPNKWSAFTVAELGEMLPVMVQSYKSFKKYWECVYDPLEIGFVEKTEANARAKMLIYLLENGLMKYGNNK